MAHDVFISCTSPDKPVGDAVCATLEANGIRCWIAPRDILPGADWGKSIVDAIAGARVMVLVFSSHANNSNHIKREVERAVNHGLPIIPLRIEDVMPEGALEYFINTQHWLDAFTGEMAEHLEKLVKVVRVLLDKEPAEQLANVPVSPPKAASIADRSFRLRPPKRVSKGHYLFFNTLLSVVIIAASIYIFPFCGNLLGQPDQKQRIEAAIIIVAIVSATMALISCRLYAKAWATIQDGHARVSPSKEVWLLFTPLFQIYWVFPVLWSFAKDYNAFLSRHNIVSASQKSTGLFQVHAVLACLNLIGLTTFFGTVFDVIGLPMNCIIGLTVTAQLCDAINDIADAAGTTKPA